MTRTLTVIMTVYSVVLLEVLDTWDMLDKPCLA